MRKKRTWTCRRQKQGVKCATVNDSIKRKCISCGASKPARRRPAHMTALDLDYEGYIKLNGGEYCKVCGRKPSKRRRLDRDHDHKDHRPRGLLCARCNRALPAWVTSKWLRDAADYLDKT